MVDVPFCHREGEEQELTELLRMDGNLSGVDFFLTAGKAGGFWCPFSCWFSFSKDLGSGWPSPAPQMDQKQKFKKKNQSQNSSRKKKNSKRIPCTPSRLGEGEKTSCFKLTKNLIQ